MRKYLQIILFGLLMVSCGTPKDIAYFQDRQPGTSAPAIIRNSTPFKVRPGDRVSIFVKSRNEKLSQQFNMYSGNSMSSMGLGNGQSGYLVDEKGEIDFPVLGKLKLEGLDRKEITDTQIQTMGRFAAIWAGAAGTKWMSDEEIRGITYAFNEPSERVFSKLGELVVKSMTEKGTIDTENIYKAISNDGYKHSEEIVRTLLSNPASIKIVYDFYKMQNDDAKLETRLAKSTNEILYGYSAEDSLVAEKLDDIMKSIPNVETKDIQDQQGFEINKFGEIIRPTEIQVQKQEQPDMVTLPNGVQIPRKQYEEEQGTKKSSKGLSIGDVKSSISKGKVTTQEIQSATQDMKKLMEIKRLQVMQKTGQALTPEQKLLIDEHIRQTQQAQMQFQQGQESKKIKRNGLEI